MLIIQKSTWKKIYLVLPIVEKAYVEEGECYCFRSAAYFLSSLAANGCCAIPLDRIVGDKVAKAFLFIYSVF